MMKLPPGARETDPILLAARPLPAWRRVLAALAHLWRWTDLPLRTKGLIVVAIPAAATVIIACASYVLGARIAAADESVNYCVQVNDEIRRLMASETAASAHMRAYLITTDEAFAGKTRDTFAVFDAARQRLASLLADDAAQTSRLDQIAALQRSRVERLFGESARFQSGASLEELRAVIGIAEVERLRMESILQTMQEEEKRRFGESQQRVATLRAELRVIVGICVFLGVVGSVVISLLFASGITNRIDRLRDNVAHLASGDAPLSMPAGGDEIGALSEGVSRAAGILRKRSEALENALHGIAEADVAGRYVSFNKAYAALTGLGEGNLPPTIAATVHADDRAGVQEAIERMRAEGRAEIEARIVHPHGRVVDAGMTFLPVAESGAGYYVFLRDISLRKETEAALMRARDAALASTRARTEFLAKISHDIRTPLNAILGAADLLSETSLNPDQSQYVSMFQRNCHRLVDLINDFLDFSRIEAGALHVQKAPFPIRQTVEDAVVTFREAASRKGIELAADTEDGIPECVLGDALRIQQVLVNLLSNAVKFTVQGRVSVTVRKTWRADGEAVLYAVSDTGPGIEAPDQAHIFAAFVQLPDQDANTRGSGLGLTICRELVERMGGEIGVTSRKGSGSTFFFTTPLEAADPSAPSTDAGAGVCPDGWLHGELPAILVVEDTEDNRLLLAHYLKGEPMDVTFATSGLEAVEFIRRNREFDLILMDIDMPVLDGYATTRIIREWQAERGVSAPTPIVALSAHAMREAVLASLEAGCVAHVAKPVDRATLLRTIRQYARSQALDPASRAAAAKLAPGVAELVPRYLASKTTEIEEARACLAAQDFDPIRRFGHNLRGTGSGYGFPHIARIGKDIEMAAAEGDETRMARQLEALHRMILSHCAPASPAVPARP
jgi:PAS domain S-box-containing protein